MEDCVFQEWPQYALPKAWSYCLFCFYLSLWSQVSFCDCPEVWNALEVKLENSQF